MLGNRTSDMTRYRAHAWRAVLREPEHTDLLDGRSPRLSELPWWNRVLVSPQAPLRYPRLYLQPRVLRGLGEAAVELRSKLAGHSVPSQKLDKPFDATSSSLEALQAYMLGRK